MAIEIELPAGLHSIRSSFKKPTAQVVISIHIYLSINQSIYLCMYLFLGSTIYRLYYF